ncbi:MAG: ATP-binding protein [Candidatus Rokubacteria bacterium]|nr:ATP-binding protein [Candidatus Rokubacteria bacterium]
MDIVRGELMAVRSSEDIVRVRQVVRQWAIELRFSLVDQTKVVTAASELARNTLDHGGGGTASLEIVKAGARQGLRLRFEDKGPGIADLALAMTEGYSTGGGLGLGLSGARKLSNDFDATSTVGQGTRVTIVRWK